MRKILPSSILMTIRYHPQFQVLCDNERCLIELRRELCKNIKNNLWLFLVKVAGWLVTHDYVRLIDQRPGDRPSALGDCIHTNKEK